MLLLAAAGAAAAAVKSSKPSLSSDPSALAKIGMPLGGGKIESVSVYGAPTDEAVPVYLSGQRIWPTKRIPVHKTLYIQVVIKRPGTVAWLTGKTQRLNLTVTTPSAHLLAHFMTVSAHQPLRLQFAQPVATVSSGSSPNRLHRQDLGTPQSVVNLPRTAVAGSMYVAAAPRSWENASPALVSWFPAGADTSAVATPQPGSTIKANTPITLTFSKPVSSALGRSMPDVSSAQGSWHRLNSHAIQFVPTGFGYGLGANVTIGLPGGVRLVGAQRIGDPAWGTWHVPQGKTIRLQQLLAVLGYLPLRFTYAGSPPGHTPAGQEAAAIKPPKGTFTWRYPNTPGGLVSMWSPGSFGEMTTAAIMSFEETNGMDVDGQVSPALWTALITAAVHNHNNTFGYTFVHVSEGSPETEQTWHDGKTVVSGLVNTGVASMPTAQGTFAVFEHAPSVTMSGTNPDGSHYVDPGIPWVSYFNGGDALHGFIRGGYGYPQSDGCVEMPYSEAAAVYPYTPIGTLVQVT